MKQFQRSVRVRAGSAPGEFEMVLATEGEASDGHILDIAGGEIPDVMPLLDGHFNSATDTMGSIVSSEKDLSSSPRRLLAKGQIEMDGEGVKADIRRDLYHMIQQGHVGAVSVRWDDVESTARINLPEDHPFRVTEDTTGPARWGRYFHKWRGMEGSVVALGADAGALIQHSMSCENETQRNYWRSMAIEASGDNTVVVDPDEPTLRDVMNELGRVNARLDEWELHTIEGEPELETEPDSNERTDQSNREPDPEPTQQAGITATEFVELLRESRKLQREDNARLLSRAIGRVT